MVINTEYNSLAFEWTPSGKHDKRFIAIAIGSLIVALAVGFTLSTIQVPVEDRKARKAVPERIAEFILEQEKQKPKIEPKPEPKPKPEPEPKPIEKPEPRVKKEQEKKDLKPLTQEQKKAREKAQETGLLALTNELADLIDTSSIDTMVARKVATKATPTKVASLDKSVLSSGAGQGSGGIDGGQYTDATIATTKLSQQEILAVRQSLLTSGQVEKIVSEESSQGVNANSRSEEEITLVFDQNKSKLYSIYNRERRKNPGLRGKIILEITIAPEGSVVSINIVSSELNNPALERRLLARIKQFKFSADKSKAITVTYPIEFLPS